jgi:hypothetical protein
MPVHYKRTVVDTVLTVIVVGSLGAVALAATAGCVVAPEVCAAVVLGGGASATEVAPAATEAGPASAENVATMAAESCPAGSLAEQLAMDEAKSGYGTRIMGRMGDEPRLVDNYGPGTWVKMQWVHKGINGARYTIHWFSNLDTGQNVEYKFVNKVPGAPPIRP